MVDCAQFNFHHRFWLNFIQFGRNLTYGWVSVRRFGRNSTNLKNNQPILALVWLKSMADIKLRAFDRFQMNFGHFGGKQNKCVPVQDLFSKKYLSVK
jgi:hypothetical protein